MDMDISMDIHAKSVDMDMDMDRKFHIHGNPGILCRPEKQKFRCANNTETAAITVAQH